MAVDAGSVYSEIRIRLNKLEGDINQAESKIDEFGKSTTRTIDDTEKKWVSSFNLMGAVSVAAIGLAIKKLADLTIKSAESLDRVDKLSQKIGISRKMFQEWDFVLKQSGASIEGLQTGVKTLSTMVEQADNGNAEAIRTFDELGVSIYDVNDNVKEQEELFNEVFAALQGYENGTKRTALATRLLGRSATELAPALNTSAENIEKLRNQAHELGLVYEDELIDKGVRLGDNLDALRGKFEAIKTRALNPVISGILNLTDKMLGQNKSTTDLEEATTNLNTQSIAYKSTLSQLLDPTVNLTEAERTRLGIIRQIQAERLDETIYQTASAYRSSMGQIKDAESALVDLMAKESAYVLVENNRDEALKRRHELTKTRNRDAQQEIEYLSLTAALLDTEFQRRSVLLTVGNDISKQQQKINELNASYATGLEAISVLVADGVASVDKFALTNREFYDAVMANVEAIQFERNEIAAATGMLKEFDGATKEVLESQIKLYEALPDGIFKTAMLDGLYKMLAASTSEVTEATNDLTDALIGQVESLDEAEFNWKAYNDAITQMSDDTTFKFLSNLVDQAQAYREAGVSEVQIEAWKAREIAKWQEGITSKELDEIKKREDALKRSYEQLLNRLLSTTPMLFRAIADSIISDLDRQMQAELEAAGIVEETKEDAARRELENIQNTNKEQLNAIEMRLNAARHAGDEQAAIALQAALDEKKALADTTEAAAKSAVEKARIEEEYQKKRAKLEYEAELWSWGVNLAGAVADTAAAVIKALPNVPLSIFSGAVGATNIATVALNKPQPPSLATGGIVLPTSGGRITRQAENGYAELDLNAGPSGDAMMGMFAQKIADKINGASSGAKSLTVNLVVDRKVLSQTVVDDINDGKVRLKKR